MSIRRTRQQKMDTAVRRDESGIRYQPTEQSVSIPVVPTKIEAHPEQKYFMMDLRKTAISTVIILFLLAFAYWTLR